MLNTIVAKVFFGSDRSPRSQDVRPSVCVGHYAPEGFKILSEVLYKERSLREILKREP